MTTYKTAKAAIASGVPGAKTIQANYVEAKKLEGIKTFDVEGREAFFCDPINMCPQTDKESNDGIWHVPVSARVPQ